MEGKKDAPASTIFGVQAVAADASASDGKSSIGMILSSGARVKVRSSEILTGNGKCGERGEDAPGIQAQRGAFGNNGADACSADVVMGAPQVVTACDGGIESTGGSGGNGERDRGGTALMANPIRQRIRSPAAEEAKVHPARRCARKAGMTQTAPTSVWGSTSR